jgi:acid phosphatase type 7
MNPEARRHYARCQLLRVWTLALLAAACRFEAKTADGCEKIEPEHLSAAPPVCDVTAVISHGPYVSAPTDTSATLIWMTSRPAQSTVYYGPHDGPMREIAPADNGLLRISDFHSVRLGGLEPGRTYTYRIATTPVPELNASWSRIGKRTLSRTFSFRTLDPASATTAFAVLADSHEKVKRLELLMSTIDWKKTDFLVHAGDAVNSVRSAKQLWETWLDPLVAGGLGDGKSLMFARGNHDTRGPYARELLRHVANDEGQYYYARDAGPVHLIVLDTGEDKPDSAAVYAGLNRMEGYAQRELDWINQHAAASSGSRKAPFTIVVLHQASGGSLSRYGVQAKAAYETAMRKLNPDLVIAGHKHIFSIRPAGSPLGNPYPIMSVGKGQVAEVSASLTELNVSVVTQNGTRIVHFTIPRRSPR